MKTRYALFGLLLLALFALAILTPPAHAAVTTVSYWRMGENDPSPGGAATSTVDQTGVRNMNLVGAPVYNSGVATAAADHTSSAWCMRFTGANYGTNALIPALTDNFGIELWVKPDNTTGTKCLAFNGNSANNGWGLYQVGATYQGLLGGCCNIGTSPFPPAIAGVWTHLALVRRNGTNTLYVDGQRYDADTSPLTTPSGIFAVAAQAQNPANERFAGYLDEVRVFTFSPGAFSTDDLLVKAIPGIPVSSSLVLWLKADAGVKTNATGSVTNWADSSFNLNPANQTTNSLAPLFVPNAVNGKPALRFDGIDDYLEIPNAQVSQPGISGWTVWCVAKRLAGSQGDYPQIIGSRPWTSNLDRGWAVSFNSSGQVCSHFANGTSGHDVTTVQSSSVLSQSAFQVWQIEEDRAANTTRFYTDGVLDRSLPSTMPATTIDQLDPIRIGREIGGLNNRRANMDLAEVLIYKRVLTSTERDSVANYLGNKYRLFPDIAVQQPAGTDLVDGTASIGFGNQLVFTMSAPKTFIITNSGEPSLILTNITAAGANPGDFTVGALGSTNLASGASTTFTVTFTPSARGARSAAIHIANNDSDESPFDIALTGTCLAPRIVMESPDMPLGIPLPGLGSVVAWGDNRSGQCNVPVAAQSGMRAIAAGGQHTVALKSDGSVLAWGDNSYGQTNVPVAAQSGVTAIAAGFSHTVALKTNGSVVAWGDNRSGQCNVPVAAQSGVTSIAAGFDHTVALKSDGSVIAWAYSFYGPTNEVPVAAQSGVTAIAAGGRNTLALKSDGSVVAWGNNDWYQNNVPFDAQSGVIAIAAGNQFFMALKSGGSVVAWGNNVVGQCNVPVGLGATAIAAGNAHSVALKSDGSVVVWGDNSSGQTTVRAAVQSGVTAIAAGGGHTVALVVGGLFADQLVFTTSAAKTCTVKNFGTAPLSITSVSVLGSSAGEFALNTSGMLSTVPIGGQTTFTFAFNPHWIGVRQATLRVLSNDPDEGTVDIGLSGLGYITQAQYDASRTAGQNDVINSPNTYSLYTLSQVQALNVGSPLLAKGTNGQFKLTIGVQKSTNLVNFLPFPMTAPQTIINAQGKLEFQFTNTDNAGFFRLQSQ